MTARETALAMAAVAAFTEFRDLPDVDYGDDPEGSSD